MSQVVPEGTVLDIGGPVTVGKYIPTLDCYTVSYNGPGHVAGRRVIEEAYEAQNER